MPVGNPNFNQGSSEEFSDGRKPDMHPALQPDTSAPSNPPEAWPPRTFPPTGQEQPQPSAQTPPRPAAAPQPRPQPTAGQMAPRPAIQPGQLAQNPHGVRIIQRPPVRPPMPGAPRGSNLPPLPPRPETRVSRGAGRWVIGLFVASVALGGAAAGDVAFNSGKLMASVGIGEGPKANTPRTNVVGTPPELPAPATTTRSKPSVTTTKPTPTKEPTATKAVPVVPIIPSTQNCIDNMPDSFLIAQKIVAPVEGDNLKAMAPLFNARHVGGAILMSSPKNPNDGSILAFKNTQKTPIEISVDQESGNPIDTTQKYGVARIKVPASKLEPKGYMPTAAQMAKMTPAQITAIVSENYAQLKKMGINTSFGAVVDVAPAKGVSVLGKDRVASSDPKVVANYAKAYIAGAEKAGVKPVIKHWGMGPATANSDNTSATTSSYTALKARDFTVYDNLRAANIKAGGMIGSEIIPGLTTDAGKDKKLGTADDVKTPASLSPAAVKEFKADLTKDALTYTDDLGAPAIAASGNSVAEAAVKAWIAGVDKALFVIPSSKDMTVVNQVDAMISVGVAALKSGELPRAEARASVTRILGANACSSLKVVDAKAYSAALAAAKKQQDAAKSQPKTSPTVTHSLATPGAKQTATAEPAKPNQTAVIKQMATVTAATSK